MCAKIPVLASNITITAVSGLQRHILNNFFNISLLFSNFTFFISERKESFINGKIIRFTRNDDIKFCVHGFFKASEVKDLTTLSKEEKDSLWTYWSFDAKQEIRKIRKQQRKNDVNRHNNSGPGKDPDKEPNKSGKIAATTATGKAVDEAKKRVWTGVNYHHKNSTGGKIGGKSPGPKNGQKALDNSIPFKEKGNQKLERRLGVEEDYFVVIDEHEPGKYHGYIVEENLDQELKNVLKAVGWMNKLGKIIKK